MTRRIIVFATTNPGKLREGRAILAHLPFDVRGLSDYPPIEPPEETGDTFEANARLKARFYALALGEWVVADDSGLEVDALGGAPGVHSARFAGAGATDAHNNAKLVAALAEVPAAKRTARFHCCAVLASPDEVRLVTHGRIEGTIIDEPRGENGFGYDPHFLATEFGVTTAEMPPETKNRVSHRGRAFAELVQQLAL